MTQKASGQADTFGAPRCWGAGAGLPRPVWAGLLLVAIVLAVGVPLGLSARTLWAAAIGVGAVGLVAASVSTSWQSAAIIAAAFLVGNAAQLALINPLWFQSIRLRPDPATLPLFALSAVNGAITLFFLRNFPGSKILSVLKDWRVVLFAGLYLCSTIAVMPYIPDRKIASFFFQSFAQMAFAVLNLGTIAALMLAIPSSEISAIAGRIASPASDNFVRRLPGIAAAFVFCAATILNLTAFDRTPRIPDEVAYLFQAKYFAAGHLYLAAPSPQIASALQFDFIAVLNNKWFSIFPPGWPAMLAIGVKAGMPNMVNPVLAALGIILSHDLLKRVVGSREAAVATLLLGLSPWYIAMAASLMSHVLTLVLTLGAWCLLTRVKNWSVGAPFAAGLLLGWLFLTRPLDGVIVGMLTGVWFLTRLNLRRANGWASLVAYALGCVILGGLIFPYNEMLTANPMLTPIDQYFNLMWHDGANRIGFGADIGPPDAWQGLDIFPGHSPGEALIQAQYTLTRLNDELFGWGIGSLTLALIHMIWGRREALDWWMIALIGVVAISVGFYWFNDNFYIGPRYWFVMLWPIVFLSTRGIFTTIGMLQAGGVSAPEARLFPAFILLTIVGMLIYLPWHGFAKYWEFRNFNGDYRPIAKMAQQQAPLIFVRTPSKGDYGSALSLNRVDFSGPVFVMSGGHKRDLAVMQAMPGRPVLFVVGRGASPDGKARLMSAAEFEVQQ